MYIEDKFDKIKKALSFILENGDKFIIQKYRNEINVETYDARMTEKIYKTRAILIKYNTRPFLLFSAIHVIIFMFFLVLLSVLNANLLQNYGLDLSFLNNWIGYILLIFFYLFFMNRIGKLINTIYYNSIWPKMAKSLRNNAIDDDFLIKEFGQNHEFEELVSFIIRKFDEMKNKATVKS